MGLGFIKGVTLVLTVLFLFISGNEFYSNKDVALVSALCAVISFGLCMLCAWSIMQEEKENNKKIKNDWNKI